MPPEVSEAQISTLVDAFYAKVRRDPEIGPIFNAIVDDWPHHLALLKDFWSTVLLATGRYKGNPMMMHLKHKSQIMPSMFDRWLGLWRETAQELLDEQDAAAVIVRAERIAESLQLGMFFKLEDRGNVAA